MGRPKKALARNTKNEAIEKSLKNELIGIFCFSLAILFTVFLYTDAAGYVGQWLVRSISFLVGEGRFFFPFFAVFLGWQFFRQKRHASMAFLSFWTLLFYVLIATYIHFQTVPAGGDLFKTGQEGVGGGMFGGVLGHILNSSFGRPGSYVLLFSFALMSLVVMTNISAVVAAKKSWKGFIIALKGLYRGLMAFLFTEVEEEEEVKQEELPVPFMEEETTSIFVDKPLLDFPAGTEEKDAKQEEEPQIYIYPGPKGRMEGSPAIASLEGPGFFPPAEENPTPIGELGNGRLTSGEFNLPPLTIFGRNLKQKLPRKNKDVTENIQLLEKTLASFGVTARVTQVSVGPAITRYELQPAPGIKVSRIVNLADDIALGLASADVRIEAPIPGKAAVGIEVPNKEISMVHVRELLESMEFNGARSKLTITLGKDIAGTPVVADLVKMPHLLIAGATGSGKSVCMNTLISSILFKARPDEVKFLMIDPKKVELTTYNGIPHLLSPVVTDAKKAATALRWIVREMESRYELFAQGGARDITRYNAMVRKRSGEENTLPLIVVVIDELADLMMVAPADVEDAICRLAQMARAAGIHLLVATQRPSVDVITGLIKANIPSRVSFAVSSQIDSRTILDMNGAEKLLGKGDMLFFPSGASKPVRVQGAYLSDREVEDLVHYLKEQGQPAYAEISFPSDSRPGNESNDDDELLAEAVRILIESGHASISLLQRRLRIGYTRAARLIDMMEEQGIVGKYEGSKPRAILMTLEQYRQKFGS